MMPFVQELCPNWDDDKAVLAWATQEQSSLKTYLENVARYVTGFTSSHLHVLYCLVVCRPFPCPGAKGGSEMTVVTFSMTDVVGGEAVGLGA